MSVSLSKEALTGATSKILANALSDNLFKDDSENFGGGVIGNIFSNGVSSATDTISNNVMKGQALTSGLGRNVGTSLASAGVGIGSSYIGQGIDSLGGHSMLSRGAGQGVATGLGTVGGQAASNLIKYGTFAGKAANGSKTALIGKGAGSINPYGLAATVAGTALGAAFGPSKEYEGKYGSITQTMDTVYDGVTAAINFVPGWGQLASGMMTLNKGLSNIFGSTSGMTKTDAILGSAFMPAPVKWLNMAGANTTGGVNNYSWQNQEKLGGFMGDAFGDTWSKINKAVDESGKTYGTFSKSAYKDAQGNINYVNSIYNSLLAMADQNEYQGIRAFDMDTINNQRYSQFIQGGFKPIVVGKQGMKILNNATNHNIGMRLLSGAALIDNKQMILSAQTGVKIPKLQYAGQIVKSDNTRVQRPVVVEPIERKLQPGQQFFNNHGQIVVVEPKQEVVQQDNRDSKIREENHKKSVQVRKQEQMKKAEEQTAQVAGAVLERTMPSYWVQQATGQDLGTTGSLAVDLASPFVLTKGIQLAGKTGQVLTKVPNIIKNKGFATVQNTPWNTTKIKWRGIGNNSYIELENNGEWLKPKMMESTYHGTGRKLYDAAIEYAQNNGYRGIMSGENLLSAPKTYNIWRHYPNKIQLQGIGSHSNAKMVLGSPFYKEVSTEKELLDATKNNVKAYREGPIIGLTEPSQKIHLRNKAGQLVKVPVNINDVRFGWQGNRYVQDQTTLEGIQNFIDNDIIPRMQAQGHNVSSYTPTFRQFSPKTDAYDEAMSKANSGSGAWFTPASNDVTIRGPLEKQDFGLTIHEAGGHGLRYNMQPDYIPTKREYLNEYIMTGGKDMSDKATNALLKMHTGDQIYNVIEAQKLRESYPWIKTYFERNPVKKSGDVVLRESGSVNTQFRSHYSNNGKVVGKELDKAIDKASPGVVLRDLIEQPYTSSIIDDIAKITGKDPDALYFYGPEMLEKLVNQYPKLQEIISKVKDTMKTVGSYGIPITIGSSTAASLYNNK